jgi:hypothetical protein
MPDDVFRIVVAVGVVLAAIAFIVQAFASLAILRTARKVQEKIDSVAGRAEPVIERAGPVLEKIGPVLEKAGPAIEKMGLVVAKAGPVIEKLGPAVDRIGPVVEKFGPVADRFGVLLASVHQAVEESRPRVAEISGEVVEIARTGRVQVERLGDLLTDAGDRARTRLEQIDHTLSSTVEQVENVGQNVKRAVTRPVREVNGLAAGLTAAFSTLVKGQKRSPDSATQDEEMFI